MIDYLDWLINSIQTILTSQGSTTSDSSDDASDDVRELTAYCKPMNTLRQLLVRLKDRILKERVVGQVYHIPCGSCDASYSCIGETERTLKARFLETWLHYLRSVTTCTYRQG